MWDPVAACLLDAWTDEALEKCERRYIAGDSQWSHERWNKQLAANAFRRGCALGEATACEVLSQALAANFFEAQDGETQQTLHQRACELSPTCGVETSALEDEGGLTNPSH